MKLKNAVSSGQISKQIGKTNGKGGKGAAVNSGKPSKQVSSLKK